MTTPVSQSDLTTLTDTTLQSGKSGWVSAASLRNLIETFIASVFGSISDFTVTGNFRTTKQVQTPLVTLTSTANLTWDATSAQTATMVLTGNATINNPVGMVDGATYLLALKQDGTGGHVITSWGSDFVWPNGGSAPGLSAPANAVDWFAFWRVGGKCLATVSKGFQP